MMVPCSLTIYFDGLHVLYVCCCLPSGRSGVDVVTLTRRWPLKMFNDRSHAQMNAFADDRPLPPQVSWSIARPLMIPTFQEPCSWWFLVSSHTGKTCGENFWAFLFKRGFLKSGTYLRMAWKFQQLPPKSWLLMNRHPQAPRHGLTFLQQRSYSTEYFLNRESPQQRISST